MITLEPSARFLLVGGGVVLYDQPWPPPSLRAEVESLARPVEARPASLCTEPNRAITSLEV